MVDGRAEAGAAATGAMPEGQASESEVDAPARSDATLATTEEAAAAGLEVTAATDAALGKKSTPEEDVRTDQKRTCWTGRQLM